ncbi:hypothetical protein BU25DRAFT_475833, partial [Macroventuria anomochaeta]
KRKAAGEPIYIAPPARKARRGRQATRITELPDELLQEVFSYIVYSNTWLQTYHSLCLVNRRMNALATPALYAYFRFDWNPKPSFSLFLTSLQAPAFTLHAKDLRWILRPNQVSLDDKAAMAGMRKA